jgi:hypothetical protein
MTDDASSPIATVETAANCLRGSTSPARHVQSSGETTAEHVSQTLEDYEMEIRPRRIVFPRVDVLQEWIHRIRSVRQRSK